MPMKTRLLAIAALAAAPFQALAAGDPWEAPFTIQIGAYSADASTTVRLDSTSGAHGTQLSFEGDLGGENRKTLPNFDLLYRFNPRHGIETSVISLRRDGDTTVTGTIHWGDQTFPVNTPIHSTFDSDVVRLAYRWSPVHDERSELGLLLGAHWTRLKTSLSSTTTNASVSQEASVSYPLPTIGVRGNARFGDNWRFTGFGQFLKLKIGDYDGELYNFGAGVEWMFSQGLFGGLGYDYYKYTLSSAKDRARGEFDYRFDGPKLYFGWNFR